MILGCIENAVLRLRGLGRAGKIAIHHNAAQALRHSSVVIVKKRVERVLRAILRPRHGVVCRYFARTSISHVGRALTGGLPRAA